MIEYRVVEKQLEKYEYNTLDVSICSKRPFFAGLSDSCWYNKSSTTNRSNHLSNCEKLR